MEIDPIWSLRHVNAMLAGVWIFVILYVVQHSAHNRDWAYRVGMFCGIAGLFTDVLKSMTILPVGNEVWLLKNACIYLATGSIAWTFWREGRHRRT